MIYKSASSAAVSTMRSAILRFNGREYKKTYHKINDTSMKNCITTMTKSAMIKFLDSHTFEIKLFANVLFVSLFAARSN
jgi:hypothetical protein